MPQPMYTSLHVNRPLTNISVAFIEGSSLDFGAASMFQTLPMEKKSDSFYTYPRDAWYTDEMKERAPDTESEGSGYDVGTDNYTCKVYGFHKAVPIEDYANFDDPLDPERDATRFVTRKKQIQEENLFVKSFLKTGVWGKDVSGVTSGETAGTSVRKWSDAASKPVEDVRYYKRYMKQVTGGFEGNVLGLTRDVYDTLLDHPAIISRISGGARSDTPAIVKRNLLAQLFEVDEIVVISGVVNTAREGKTRNMQFMGSKSALLIYRPPAPGLYTPAAGYTFRWRKYEEIGGYQGLAIKRIPTPLRNSVRIEIGAAYVQKVIAADLGVFFDQVIA